ncbi:MAG TPA: hypothetical protein PKC74_05525, partial [Turneriella sp.]|nr:hypothetical protein [Turneriella sp.]
MPDRTLNDCFEETLRPLVTLKPLFLLRDGILNPFERVLLKHDRGLRISSQRPAQELAQLRALHGLGHFDEAPANNPLQPADLLSRIGERITQDCRLLPEKYLHPKDLQLEGSVEQLYVHPEAKVSRHAVIDSSEGPVVIDSQARISALSFVKGPA